MASVLPTGLPTANSTIVNVAFNMQEMLENLSRNLNSVGNMEKVMQFNLMWMSTLICLLTLYRLITTVFKWGNQNQASVRTHRHEIVTHTMQPSVTWSSYRPEAAKKTEDGPSEEAN